MALEFLFKVVRVIAATGAVVGASAVAVPLLAIAAMAKGGKKTYFNDAIEVTYTKGKKGVPDRICFLARDVGTYDIAFSLATEEEHVRGEVPDDFRWRVAALPQKRVIERYLLPKNLRITIVRGGSVQESEIFGVDTEE